MQNIFEEIINKLKNHETEFSFLMSRPQSVQRDELFYTAFDVYADIKSPEIMSLPLEGNNRAMYIEKDLLSGVLEHLAEKVSNAERFKKHIEDFKNVEQSFFRAGIVFSNTTKEKSEIAKSFDLMNSQLKSFADFAWAPVAVEKIVAPRLLSLLTEKYKNGEEIYLKVASPTKLNQFQKMRIDICDIVIENKNSEKEISNLVSKYNWYNEYSYVEDLCDEKYFESEIKKLNIKNATEEKSRIISEVTENEKNVISAKKEITDPEINHLIDVVAEYTFLRTERVDLLKKLQAPFRRIFNLIAELLESETGFQWKKNDVVKLMNKEIFAYLRDGIAPDYNSVIARKNFVFYRNLSDELVTTDEEIVSEIKNLIQSDPNKSIKGSVAFRGCVRGRVAIVLSKEDLNKIKDEGMVLVARTTMPDFIHTMEKAVAFVTEEGGITSHAAIIARELKKPCIVGTGNCTKVLKDDDMIEVDANNGVVTKI